MVFFISKIYVIFKIYVTFHLFIFCLCSVTVRSDAVLEQVPLVLTRVPLLWVHVAPGIQLPRDECTGAFPDTDSCPSAWAPSLLSVMSPSLVSPQKHLAAFSIFNFPSLITNFLVWLSLQVLTLQFLVIGVKYFSLTCWNLAVFAILLLCGLEGCLSCSVGVLDVSRR